MNTRLPSLRPFSGLLGSLLFKMVLASCVALPVADSARAQGVAQVAAGGDHSLFLKQDGSVWATGYNGYGQIGDGTNTPRPTPTLVMTGVASIASGWAHNLLLKADGTVWAVGINMYGELGDGSTISRSVPVQVMSGVKAVAAATWHSLFLKTDGTVWSCGHNAYGRLGDGTGTDRSVPTQVRTASGPLTNVASISAGSYHSLFVKTDGTLWAAGANGEGQFGNGTSTGSEYVIQVLDPVTGLPVTNIKTVSAGNLHSLWLKTDNTVWGTGDNMHGQLGDGTFDNDRYSPIPIMAGSTFSRISAGSLHSLFVKSNGTAWAAGFTGWGLLGNGTEAWDYATVPVQVLSGVADAHAGDDHSLFLKTDGCVFGSGSRYGGVFGDGIYTSFGAYEPVSYTTPTKIFVAPQARRFAGVFFTGGIYSLGTKADGTVWGMGTGYGTTASQVGGLSSITSISQGYLGANASTQKRFALVENGTVRAWNTTTNPNPTTVGGLAGVKALSNASLGYSTLALRSNGTVCSISGDNYTVTEIMDDETYHTGPLGGIVQISSTRYSHLALRSTGTIEAWGDNDNGQLGDGTTTSRPEPFEVLASGGYSLFDNVVAVASGIQSNFALRTDGTVWSWGYGYLGNGPLSTSLYPVQVSGLTNVVAIYATHWQTFAIKSDGTVVAWGANSAGQLGNGTTATQNTPVVVSGLSNVVEVVPCNGFTFFRRQDGTIYACGSNGSGQIGGGSTGHRLTPTLVTAY